MQFFNFNIIKKDIIFNDYWLLNMFELNNESIDFQKCKISVVTKKKEGGTERKLLTINSLSEFIEVVNFYKKNMEIVSINNIYLNSNVSEDFFMLQYVEGGIKYIVSEKLKKEIEDAGCTGIEFQPVELSYNEWTIPGGEREKIYGKV